MNGVDVVIVGGSLAGASCALELNRLGIDAIAIERELFPREKVCGGFVSPGAVQILDELGVLDQVRGAGAVEVQIAQVRVGDAEVTFALPRPGLGISRNALDAVVAANSRLHHASVLEILREDEGFRVRLDKGEVAAKVVVDASGKQSRFTARNTSPQFGVQMYLPEDRGKVMDFWFFRHGYGGAVAVDGGRSNLCFLIDKAALPKYLHRPGCRVTGPLAYGQSRSEWIAIGDAAGMVDPFCGEGIRHALDTGRLAAFAVADGIRKGCTYEQMRARYDAEHASRWAGKRRMAKVVRGLLRYPRVVTSGLRRNPQWFLQQFWN